MPDAEERAYAGWHAIGYRHPKAGCFCGIFPCEGEVRLLFEHGAALPDPDGVLTHGGAQTRYVPLRPGEAVPERALVRLLILAATR